MAETRIKVEAVGKLEGRAEIEKVVKEDIDIFSDWYVQTFPGAEPMRTFERLTIQTYLIARLSGKYPATKEPAPAVDRAQPPG